MCHCMTNFKSSHVMLPMKLSIQKEGYLGLNYTSDLIRLHFSTISRAGRRKIPKAHVALKFHHLPMLVPHELLQLFNRPALHVTQPRGCLLDAIAINHNARSEMWGHDGDHAREGAHDAVPGIPRQERLTYLASRLPSAVSDLS